MKILQINTTDIKGGAANLAHDLKNNLAQKGHVVINFVGKKYTKENNNIFLVQKPNLLFKLIKKITNRDPNRYLTEKIQKFFPSDIDFFNNKNLFKNNFYKEADIIHCHNLHNGYFNLKNLMKISQKKPIIWTLHDMWPITHKCPYALEGKEKEGFFECPKNNKIFPKNFWKNENYLKKQKRKIYEKSNFDIVVPSLWLKRKVEQSILKNKKIHLIHNGIDNKKFRPYNKTITRKELGLPEDAKIISFFAHGGRTNPWKGWEHFERIINHYRNNSKTFFLYTENPDKKLENNPNVINIQYTKNDNLWAKYYSVTDIFLFPSLAENMPLAVMESMACGTPVVGFDTGGVKEIIDHKKNGYVAEYQNTKDLKNGIEYIFNLNKQDSKTLSENAIKKISEKFTFEKMTNKYIKLYKEKINEKN